MFLGLLKQRSWMIVAMETHLLSNIALPLLLFAATHHSISAVTVRTVEADQWHCGETLVLAEEVDTYRVVVPKPSASNQNCPTSNTSFDCSIHFKLHQPASSSSGWRHDQRQICVDYARVRLKGDSTYLTISRRNQQSVQEQMQELTSSKFSQLRKYMATVKCTSSRETVTLTFQSACKYSLRHYFISWIYVYHQPSKYDLIYHIDGTCRHKDPISLPSYQKVTLTVRSYIWHDTAQEPDLQNCNLKVSSYASFSLDIDSVKLCPRWDFQHFSCQVTAHLQEAVFMVDNDCSDGKNATCHTRRWHTLNSCVPLRVLKSPLFCVRRDQRIPDEEPVPDGAMFFQMNAELQIVKKKYDTIYNPGYTDDDNSYHTEGDTYHTDGDSYTVKGDNLKGIVKIMLPLIVLFSICSCLGGIARKKAKRTPQPQHGVNPSDDYTCPAGPVPDYMRSGRAAESVAMEPLVASYRISFPADRPHSTDLSRTRQSNDGSSWVGPGGVGVAAPPPSYNDVATATPSAPTGSQGSGQPTTGSGPLTPPPPISAVPPVAPPAYHELFPSNA